MEVSLIRKHLLWVILIALLAAVAYTASSARQPDHTSDDTTHFITMVAKEMDPSLYASDYYFADDTFFRFYIPWYRLILAKLWHLTGSFGMALVYVVPITVTLYVLGMTLLLTRFSGWVWVALGLAVMSTAYRSVMAYGIWGVAGSYLMLPRTLYTAVVPILFWLMFRWLSSPSLKLSIVTGACMGLAANAHPTSGLFLVWFAIGLFLLTPGHSWRQGVHLLALLAAALICALPVAITILSNFGQPVPAEVSFQAFSRIVMERIGVPFHPQVFTFDLIGVSLARPGLDYLVWAYLAITAVLGALLLAKRRWLVKQAGLVWLAGGLVVLSYAFMVALFNETLLFAIAGLYIIYRHLRPPIRDLDWWALGLMFLVVLLTFVGYYVMAWVWQALEWWGFTSLLFELPRGARYVYVPVFLLCARAAAAWIPEMRRGGEWLRGLVRRKQPVSDTAAATALDEPALALAFGLVFAVGPAIWRHFPHTIPGVVIGVGAFFVAVMLLGYGFHIVNRLVARPWPMVAALVMLIVVFFTPVGSGVQAYSPLPVPVIGPSAAQPEGRETDSSRELYAWAQSDTPIDALFYWCHLEGRAEMYFRAKAQRSITHSWKDLGHTIYERAHLVAFYDRYRRLTDACSARETAMTMARELKADYILTPSGLGEVGTALCFKNAEYAVYAVGDLCPGGDDGTGFDLRGPQSPMQISLGKQIKLLGYSMLSTIGEAPALSVRLHWQATGPIDADYTVFVQLLDQGNQLVTSRDSQPLVGQYPTSRWQPGEVVVDEFSLTLPEHLPPGRYRLVTGMYDLVTGRRLPATDAAGQPLPDDMVVLMEMQR